MPRARSSRMGKPSAERYFVGRSGTLQLPPVSHEQRPFLARTPDSLPRRTCHGQGRFAPLRGWEPLTGQNRRGFSVSGPAGGTPPHLRYTAWGKASPCLCSW
jgi:hypothetical protein